MDRVHCRATYCLVGCLLAFKAVYAIATLALVTWWPWMDTQMFGWVLARWPREGGPTFGSHFATWDGAHYLFLSEVGYMPSSPSCAFYPLWPLLMRLAGSVAGGSHLVPSLVLANLASLAGCVMFYHLIRARFDHPTATRALLCLLAYPGSIFFQFPYSEGLFFLLMMSVWAALDKGSYGWAALAAFFLPLTRPVGFLCGLPLLYHLIKRRRSARDYIVLAGLACGGAGYFALMTLMTGNPLEGFDAQRNWPANSLLNVVDLPKFATAFLSLSGWHQYEGSVLDRAMFYGLVLCLPAVWKLDREWFLWAVVLGVLPAMISSFVSYTRYSVMSVAVFVVIARWPNEGRARLARPGLVAVFALLHIVLLLRHINFRWAG